MAGAMVEGWRAPASTCPARSSIRPSGSAGRRRPPSPIIPRRAPRFVMLGVQAAEARRGRAGARADPVRTPSSFRCSPASRRHAARALPERRAIVRAMPNLPVAQRQGVTALYSERRGSRGCASCRKLMAALGHAAWCDDEAELPRSARSPAPARPMSRASSTRLPRRRAARPRSGPAERSPRPDGGRNRGSGRDDGEAMSEVARRVASPKGTTEAGLAVLDADRGLEHLVDRTIEAARRAPRAGRRSRPRD